MKNNKSKLGKCLRFFTRLNYNSKLCRWREIVVLLSFLLSICFFFFICNIQLEENVKRFHVEDCVTWGDFCSAVSEYYHKISEDAKENIELVNKGEKIEFTVATCRFPLKIHYYVHFFNDGVIWFETDDVIPYEFLHKEKVIGFWNAEKEIKFVSWENFHEFINSLEKGQNSLLSFSADPSLKFLDHWFQFRYLFDRFPKERIVHIYNEYIFICANQNVNIPVPHSYDNIKEEKIESFINKLVLLQDKTISKENIEQIFLYKEKYEREFAAALLKRGFLLYKLLNPKISQKS